jgi:arylsulfatase A-like enzyme
MPSPLFGRARDYDVIFYLYESLPWVCASGPAADTALPNLRALTGRGFRADAHYATYPYSRRAYLSIYAAWYPGNAIRGAFEELGRLTRDLAAPGVVRAAANAGYETAAFVPEEPVAREEDELRYAALGFAKHHVPPSAYRRPDAPADSGESRRSWSRVRDAESFDSLKASVERAVAANRRYLYAYHPQLTHGPWPGLQAGSGPGATCKAGLALFHEVDTHLGELMRLLERVGRLDRTIIVALGDHGLRTRREYPPFRPGTLDDVTFHVPLSLWAPGVVDSTVAIPWMTSHIDIAPSVLDLLGISAGRDLEMGSPMWDARLASRTTYFFAREYLGADGYQRDAEAVMLRYLYGGVSRAEWNGQLRFRVSDLLQRADTVARRVARDLRLTGAVQQRLTRTMLPSAADHVREPAPPRRERLVRR